MDHDEFQVIKKQIVGQGIEGKIFDFDEPNAKLLLEDVRKWKKKDVHTHISASVSPEYLLSRYLVFEEIYGKPAFKVMNDKINHLSRSINSNLALDFGANVSVLLCYDVDSGLHHYYEERGKIPDAIIKFNLNEFRLAIADISRQHFRDNVTDLELRFFPSGLSDGSSVESVVYAVYDGFQQAEKEYPDCKASMIFTFNRNKADMLTVMPNYLDILHRIKQNDRIVGERMIGIDLSGFPDIAERTREREAVTVNYVKQLRSAKDKGFFLTCHMGEYYGNDPDQMSLSISTLKFCIENMELDRVGHGIVLDRIRAKALDNTGSLDKDVLEVIDLIKQRGVVIESCPFVYVGSNLVEKYRDFPVHYWIREGVKVHLGTDGLWTYPTSLSKEAVKVLISNPYNLSIDAMKRIVG